MGFSLPRKLKDNFLTRGASRAFDQVNPFDNNRTWQQRTPTQSKSTVQQIGQLGGQTARAVGGGTARLLNTTAATISEIPATVRGEVAMRTGNQKALSNALTAQRNMRDQLYGTQNQGLLGRGTIFKSPEERLTASPADVIKRVGGAVAESGLEVVSAGMGGVAGKTIARQGIRQGLKTQLPTIGKNALLNTAQGGVNAYNQGASGKDILKSAAIGGTVGTVADVGLGLASAGVSRAAKSKIKPVEAMYDPKIKAAQKQTLESIAEKPKVSIKETRIDPNDPFGNSKYLKRLKNDAGKLFVDEDAPMINMLRKMEKDTGRTDLVEQFMFDTNTQRASRSIANAKVKNSPDFEAAVKGLSKKDLDNFDTYAAAKAELLNYDGKKTSKNAETLAAIVRDGDAQFSARYDSLNKYYKSLAEDLRKEGIISDAQFQEFTKDGNYIRLQRNMEDLVAPNVGASRARSLNTTSANQKRMGSSREVLPPTQTAIARTQQLQNEIQKNSTARNTLKNLEQYGLAKEIKEPKGKNTISFRDGGTVRHFEVPKDIKEVMDNVQPYTLGAVAQIVSAPARVFRAGTTALSAPFTVTNYLRDQASSGIYSKNVIATHNPQNIIAGLRKATRDFVGETNDPLWKKFETYAGDQTIFDELRNVKNTKLLLREQRLGTKGKWGNRVSSVPQVIRGLEDLNSITEKATRFQNFKGIYEKAIKEGAGESVAIRKAVQAAYDNSVNFQRSGTASRVINMFIPYFNAGIQGSRNVARSFRDRPMATSVKSIGYVAAPAIAATAYNMSDERRREVYENINDFEKENNYIIVLPGAKQKEDGSYEGVIKIPKPQGYRELVDPTRDMAEQFFRGEKPEVAASMLKDMLGGFTGPINTEDAGKFISSITPQAAKPLLQAGINKDLYTGGQVVPDYMMEETSDPTKRKYEGTSDTANWIAQQLGVEPIKVEKFVSDTFGSLGRYGLNTADNAVKATGNEDWVVGGRSAKSDFSRRMFEASAKEKENPSAGQQYYKDRQEITKGLSSNAKAAYDTLHPKKENFLGETMYDQDSIFNKNARLDIYKRYPEVFEADKELDRRNRERGQPGNPLYDLTQEQMTRVLFKEALPPGAKDPELSALYKEQWYQDYRNKKTAFFDQLRAKAAQEGKPWSDGQNPYPEPTPQLQAKLDQYNALPKGTGARSAFLKANPDVLAQWDAVDNWENGQRVRMGLSPVGDETQFGSASVSSGSGYGGGYGSSSSRSSGRSSGSRSVSFKKPTVPAGKALDKVSIKSKAPEIRTKKSVKRRPRPKIQLKKSMV